MWAFRKAKLHGNFYWKMTVPGTNTRESSKFVPVHVAFCIRLSITLLFSRYFVRDVRLTGFMFNRVVVPHPLFTTHFALLPVQRRVFSVWHRDEASVQSVLQFQSVLVDEASVQRCFVQPWAPTPSGAEHVKNSSWGRGTMRSRHGRKDFTI